MNFELTPEELDELHDMLEEWVSEGFRSQPFDALVVSVLDKFGVTRGVKPSALDTKPTSEEK